VELIVLATRNEGKARELIPLLHGVAERFETLRAHPGITLPPEIGSTYSENAIAKALAVYDAIGIPALGDDSGLEVDVLGGAPGLLSARYAGDGASDRANNDKLLRALEDVPPERRTARFRCSLALIRGPGDWVLVDGACEGVILDAPRGSGGFGYDPLFMPSGETLTFAELPDERKNALSHRARAAAALRQAIR
jgi:XTP/dITP diphosphohydrolase